MLLYTPPKLISHRKRPTSRFKEKKKQEIDKKIKYWLYAINLWQNILFFGSTNDSRIFSCLDKRLFLICYFAVPIFRALCWHSLCCEHKGSTSLPVSNLNITSKTTDFVFGIFWCMHALSDYFSRPTSIVCRRD